VGKRKSKPGNAKIVFAILAHEDEALLASQIRNLRHFNDDAEIVLYNGGPNPKFGRGAGVPICPYSKPLKYEFLTEFRIDVARWLEEAGTKYEYLVNLDHDMLFVKRGFGSFLDEWMAGFDAMGYEPTISHHPMEYGIYSSKAVPAMWGEWKRWQPVFGLNLFVWMLNAGQVYRRGLVRSILSRIDRKTLYPTLRATKVTAAEEMVFPTLARACGANLRSYPPDELGVVSMEPLPWWKVELARVHPHAYWIHPAKGELGIRCGLSTCKPLHREGAGNLRRVGLGRGSGDPVGRERPTSPTLDVRTGVRPLLPPRQSAQRHGVGHPGAIGRRGRPGDSMAGQRRREPNVVLDACRTRVFSPFEPSQLKGIGYRRGERGTRNTIPAERRAT